jgi:hypothetical protein
MPWRVTFRAGGRVDRRRAATLAESLDVLEALSRAVADGPGLAAVDVRSRRWEPSERIAARGELRGPQRWRPDVRGGLDVRGDGSVQAWTGAPRREALEPRDGEEPYAALRRVLAAQSVNVEP